MSLDIRDDVVHHDGTLVDVVKNFWHTLWSDRNAVQALPGEKWAEHATIVYRELLKTMHQP